MSKASRSKSTMLTSRGVVLQSDPSVTLEDIKSAFFNGKLSRSTAIRCVKNRPDLRELLIEYANKHNLQNDSVRKLIVNYVFGITERPLCAVCGKDVGFNVGIWRYSRHCSPRCRALDPDVRSIREGTCRKVYGVDNPAKNTGVKTKMKETLLKKYGATCYLASAVGTEKLKNTLLERYGVTSAPLIPGVREKRDATMLRLYGTKSSLRNSAIMAKRDETCMRRFGCKYPGAAKLKELADRTRLDVYDRLDKMFPDYELLCGRDEFFGVYEHSNTWRCKACNSTFTREGAPFCKCRLKWKSQSEVFEFVKGVRSDAIFGDRSVLNGHELDVYVPSLKLGIEYDGLFWHSEDMGKDRNYHVAKTNAAAKLGVRVIHIFEDEWLCKRTIVESKLKAILGVRLRSVYARKCKVVEVASEVARVFMDKYHIQGMSDSPVHLGLEHKGRVVAVCSFKRKSRKDNSWYLTRYATIRSFRVLGGCGKLLASFVKKFYPTVVRTFADRRWSEGKMYTSIGFDKVCVSKPSYWYVSNGSRSRIHRFNLRKNNKKMFPIAYDEGMTEHELAKANGYSRIWDCGQIVFDYTDRLTTGHEIVRPPQKCGERSKPEDFATQVTDEARRPAP